MRHSAASAAASLGRCVSRRTEAPSLTTAPSRASSAASRARHLARQARPRSRENAVLGRPGRVGRTAVEGGKRLDDPLAAALANVFVRSRRRHRPRTHAASPRAPKSDAASLSVRLRLAQKRARPRPRGASSRSAARRGIGLALHRGERGEALGPGTAARRRKDINHAAAGDGPLRRLVAQDQRIAVNRPDRPVEHELREARSAGRDRGTFEDARRARSRPRQRNGHGRASNARAPSPRPPARGAAHRFSGPAAARCRSRPSRRGRSASPRHRRRG